MKSHIVDRNVKLKARYWRNRAAGQRMDDAIAEVTEWHNRRNPQSPLAMETIRIIIFSSAVKKKLPA